MTSHQGWLLWFLVWFGRWRLLYNKIYKGAYSNQFNISGGFTTKSCSCTLHTSRTDKSNRWTTWRGGRRRLARPEPGHTWDLHPRSFHPRVEMADQCPLSVSSLVSPCHTTLSNQSNPTRDLAHQSNGQYLCREVDDCLGTIIVVTEIYSNGGLV